MSRGGARMLALKSASPFLPDRDPAVKGRVDLLENGLAIPRQSASDGQVVGGMVGPEDGGGGIGLDGEDLNSFNRPSIGGSSKRFCSASVKMGADGTSIRVKADRNSGSMAVASRAEASACSTLRSMPPGTE